MSVSGKDIFEAALKDPSFAEQLNGPALPVQKEFFENQLPAALGQTLDQPAAAKSLCQAKTAIAQALLDHDIIGKMCRAMAAAVKPEITGNSMADALNGLLAGLVDPEEQAKAASQALKSLIEQMNGILNDFPGFLSSYGMTEKELLEGMQVDPETIQAILNGKMTVGQVIVAAPNAMLRFDQ